MTPRAPRERKSLRRRGAWAALALLSVGVIALVLWLGAPRPEVEVVAVTRGEYVRYVEEDGRARVRDRYVVSAPVAATLERPVLEVGDRVSAGDVVALLHPVPSPLLDVRSRAELEERRGGAEARVASARAASARAEASRALAETDLGRARQLARSGAIAAQELDRAELALETAARARDEARQATHLAEHDLEQAHAALRSITPGANGGRFEVRAPVDGRVLSVAAESEAVVPQGTPIVVLGDPTALEIVVDLLSTDAVRVDPGTEAEIVGWGGDAVLRGTVRLVEPVAFVHVSALGVEEERVGVVVDPVETDERWARVGDGYRVDVRIPVERIEDTLRVPTSALFRLGDEWKTFVVRGGVLRELAVEVASYGPLESAISGGLAEGERVVVQPAESLRDGQRVDVRAATSP